ncbi:unnamed protein product [Laminaria digitata]
MTAMKRSLDEISQAPASGLSKTERRRAAKQAKKERLGKGDGGGGDGSGSKQRKGGAGGDAATPRRNGKKGPKPKMTKEERRTKYTQKAYEAREKQNQAGPGANKTRCLGCRAWGHIVANCPDDKKSRMGICFNCGSSKHALRVCPKPKHKDGALPHATCFVCKEKGHISAHCKLNANGIYPKGGFCKGCGSKHHLSWDCPDNPQTDKKKTNRKEASTATVAAAPGSDGEGESTALAPAAEPRDGGKGGTAVTAAAGDKAKRRKADNPGSHARGAKTPPAALPGGDDLEDDGYYEPEDMPEVRVDAEGGEEFGGAGVARKGAAGSAPAPAKKKSKIVVF